MLGAREPLFNQGVVDACASREKLLMDGWVALPGVLTPAARARLVAALRHAQQLNDALVLKKQESSNLEKAYESIMKQARARKAEEAEDNSNVKSGGVLV